VHTTVSAIWPRGRGHRMCTCTACARLKPQQSCCRWPLACLGDGAQRLDLALAGPSKLRPRFRGCSANAPCSGGRPPCCAQLSRGCGCCCLINVVLAPPFIPPTVSRLWMHATATASSRWSRSLQRCDASLPFSSTSRRWCVPLGPCRTTSCTSCQVLPCSASRTTCS
jgi:hypothetical protein